MEKIIDPSRIILSSKDNFGNGKNWPCGPCSEIHIDIRMIMKLK